jgi:predicted SAM-dependent methyltransferase
LDPDAIHVARQNGLTVLNQDLKEYAIAHKEQYDVVCAFQVLEHITEVRSFVEHCLLCLKPSGILIFGVPNSNPYLHRFDRLHTLNLPPHHAGLCDKQTMNRLSDFFHMSTQAVHVAPLVAFKDYWNVLLREYKINGYSAYHFLKSIPGPTYKFLRYLIRNKIEGRHMLGVF